MAEQMLEHIGHRNAGYTYTYFLFWFCDHYRSVFISTMDCLLDYHWQTVGRGGGSNQ